MNSGQDFLLPWNVEISSQALGCAWKSVHLSNLFTIVRSGTQVLEWTIFAHSSDWQRKGSVRRAGHGIFIIWYFYMLIKAMSCLNFKKAMVFSYLWMQWYPFTYNSLKKFVSFFFSFYLRYAGWGVCHEPIASEILNLFEVRRYQISSIRLSAKEGTFFLTSSLHAPSFLFSSHLHFCIQTPLPQRGLGFLSVKHNFARMTFHW